MEGARAASLTEANILGGRALAVMYCMAILLDLQILHDKWTAFFHVIVCVDSSNEWRYQHEQPS